MLITVTAFDFAIALAIGFCAVIGLLMLKSILGSWVKVIGLAALAAIVISQLSALV